MGNPYEYFRCDACKCYLISGWGDIQVAFRANRGMMICATCDPHTCKDCEKIEAECICAEENWGKFTKKKCETYGSEE